MSIRNFNEILIVQDALTGEVIVNLPTNSLTPSTIESILADLIAGDSIDKHGFIIKYGIRS